MHYWSVCFFLFFRGIINETYWHILHLRHLERWTFSQCDVREDSQRKTSVNSGLFSSAVKEWWGALQWGFEGNPCLFLNLLNTDTVLTCFVPAPLQQPPPPHTDTHPSSATISKHSPFQSWVNLQSRSRGSLALISVQWRSQEAQGTLKLPALNPAVLAGHSEITACHLEPMLKPSQPRSVQSHWPQLSVICSVFLFTSSFASTSFCLMCLTTVSHLHWWLALLLLPVLYCVWSFPLNRKQVHLIRGLRREHLECRGIKLVFVLEICCVVCPVTSGCFYFFGEPACLWLNVVFLDPT